MAAQGDQNKPAWITEVGYPTLLNATIPGQTPEMQGRWLPRVFLSLFQAGIQRVFWYEFTDPGDTSSTSAEYHFGITNSNLSAKPGYSAYKTLARVRPSGSTVLDSNLWRSADSSIYYPHWKRPDGKTAWALWRPEAMGGAVQQALTLEGTLDSAFTYLGTDTTAGLKAALSGSTLTVEVDSSIIYLIGPSNINHWGSTAARRPVAPHPVVKTPASTSSSGPSILHDIRGRVSGSRTDRALPAGVYVGQAAGGYYFEAILDKHEASRKLIAGN